MKKTITKATGLLLALTMLFCFSACSQDKQSPTDTDVVTSSLQQLGQGEKSFFFTVINADASKKAYEINTDEQTVGAALLSLGLIAGDEGPYGLYVKTVDGVSLDYDTDGKYWAFYKGDEYATAGVDMTDITEGEFYSFRAE